MHTHRLEALTDGIFAFAMTLLVLSINLPDPKEHIDVAVFIMSQFQNFWTFALGFLLLASFWLNYSQQYHHIEKTNTTTVMLNILILLFVVLMPFSTSVMNDYPRDMFAEVFFNGNFFILSLLLSINWHYCLKQKFINTDDRALIGKKTKNVVALPIISLIALGTAFIFPGWSTLMYLLIPMVMFFPTKRSS